MKIVLPVTDIATPIFGLIMVTYPEHIYQIIFLWLLSVSCSLLLTIIDGILQRLVNKGRIIMQEDEIKTFIIALYLITGLVTLVIYCAIYDIIKGKIDTISKIIGILCFFIIIISVSIFFKIKMKYSLIVGQIILLIVSVVGFHLKAETTWLGLGLGCLIYFVYAWIGWEFFDIFEWSPEEGEYDEASNPIAVRINGKTVVVCCISGTYKEIFDYVDSLGYKKYKVYISEGIYIYRRNYLEKDSRTVVVKVNSEDEEE